MDKLDGMSLNVEQAEIDKLRTVFPQCFNEGKLDLSKLLALLGEYDDNDFEKYKFEWKGKSESLRLAQTRSMGTLRPALAESVDWDTTQNVYIEGDNLEVLKLLQTDYYRRIKMIYIDPPYNTGHDFVYEDDFKDPLNRYKEITGQITKSNPEAAGRYHTNWLNMMYPRLRLAANLLRDDGVIFISIDDNEVFNLKKLCDEIFGEENYFANISWHKNYASANDAKKFSNVLDYILVYQKSEAFTRNLLPRTEKQDKLYKYDSGDGKGLWRPDNLTVKSYSEKYDYPIINPNTGEEYNPSNGRCWITNPDTMKRWIEEGRVFFGQDGKGAPQLKRYLSEVQQGVVPTTYWSYEDCGHNDLARKEIKSLFETPPFDTPKPTDLIRQILRIGTNNNADDIILDFFSGSSTTAHAVMQLNSEDGGNRKFIMVQLPEKTDDKSEAYKAGFMNLCEVGKERIRRAGTKVQSEWVATNGKKANDLFAETVEPQSPPDIGFKVFKLDTSNLKTWDSTPVDKNDAQQMDLLLDRMNDMIDTIKNDRSDLDIVYEVILKMGGVDLTDPVREVEIDGKRAYTIGENDEMLLCLQEGLTAEIIEKMADEFIPSKMILSEKCFTDDTAMANAHYILKEREIELKLV